MNMLFSLEWDAIIVGAVLSSLVGWCWFSTNVCRTVFQKEGVASMKSVNMKLALTVDSVSTLLLAVMVAVVLRAFGGDIAIDGNWLTAVIFTILVVNSGTASGALWQGRSFSFIRAVNFGYVIQVTLMALTYVLWERYVM